MRQSGLLPCSVNVLAPVLRAAGIFGGVRSHAQSVWLKCVPWGQVNYNLLTVNAFMAVTGMYQLSRKLRLDYGEKFGISPEAPRPEASK